MSEEKDKIENPEAFPHPEYHEIFGMSLRDYFAAKAMQALKTNETKWLSNYSDLAEFAYEIADAMLKERMKK